MAAKNGDRGIDGERNTICIDDLHPTPYFLSYLTTPVNNLFCVIFLRRREANGLTSTASTVMAMDQQ